MPKEADKLKDLFIGKNILRYTKKGLLFLLLFGLISTILNLFVVWIVSAFGIDLSVGIMSALGTGGFKIAFVLFASLIIQWLVAGFLAEYINNSRNKAIKWVQK